MTHPLRRAGTWVVVLSGIIGFYAGVVLFPRWQVAVETAQVVAGLVEYPRDNPFYTYHTKIWTVMHQAGALLLLAGVPEKTLSLILSGLMGMLSCQALSLTAYALSGSATVAVGMPFLAFATGIVDHGVVYPIALAGSEHTYGMVGLSAAGVTLGLFGAGYVRSGAFLLGLLPAIHPAIGVWTMAAATVALAWERRAIWPAYRYALWWFLAGAGVTVASGLHQWAFILDVPDTESEVSARYLRAFVAFWDGHRFPVDIGHLGVAMNGLAGLLAAMWLSARAEALSPPVRVLLRMIMVVAIMSVAIIGVSWVPPAHVPTVLLMLMPARFLNLNVLLFVPLVIGLARSLRKDSYGDVVVALMVVGLLVGSPSMFWGYMTRWGVHEWPHLIDHRLVFELAAVSLAGLCATCRYRAGGVSRAPDPAPTTNAWLKPALNVCVIALFVVTAALCTRFDAGTPLVDRTNDPFWSQVAADQRGMTLTAGSFIMVQLRSRRPVLLNSGGLDGLPYAPESGPAMNAILQDVYGVDLLNPHPDLLWGTGGMQHHFNERVWEGFSLERWREIGRTYGVSQVITRTSYDLALPLMAERDGLRLYMVPN